MSRILAGVDEVGRGPLAGPVVAAAVILPPEDAAWISEIKDSKKLSRKKREYISECITAECAYTIREVPAHVIDHMNILYASLYAMKLAVDALFRRAEENKKPEIILIDGNKTIPTIAEGGEGWLDLPVEQTAIVNGDTINKSIGAASIIAKVYRDRIMQREHEIYPNYGFDKHVGYGTKQHLAALKEFGPCPIHRMTFSGVYQNKR